MAECVCHVDLPDGAECVCYVDFTRMGAECVNQVDLPEWGLNVYVLLIYQSGD